MYKSYTVQGNKLIIEFEHAEGGLVVAEAGSNAIGRAEGATGFANPKIIEQGDEQMKLFYLAGIDRVWHPALADVRQPLTTRAEMTIVIYDCFGGNSGHALLRFSQFLYGCCNWPLE